MLLLLTSLYHILYLSLLVFHFANMDFFMMKTKRAAEFFLLPFRNL